MEEVARKHGPAAYAGAVVAGAGLVGLLHGALASWEATLWERLATGMASDWLAAAALGAVAFLAAAALRCRPGPAAGFWIGAAAGAGPALSEAGLGPVLAAAAALVLAVALPLLLRRGPSLPRPVSTALGLAGVWILALALALRPPPAEEEQEAAFPPRSDAVPTGPDVLLISVDTLRADALNGERPPGLALPTFDRLRAEGLSAEFARSPSNQTLPGHLGMLTGLDAMDIRVRYNLDRVPPGHRLLSTRFRDAGWRTGAVVSNALIAGELGFSQGFEIYDDSLVMQRGRVRGLARGLQAHSWLGWLLEERDLIRGLDLTVMRAVRQAERERSRRHPGRGRGRSTSERALRLLDALLAEERPWFLFVHYMDPHAPYGPPDPWFGRVTSALPPLAEAYQPRRGDGRLGNNPEMEKIKEDLGTDAEPAAREAIRFLHGAYLEEVAFVDHCVGMLLERIAASGRETVVLLTADHGEHFGEHGLMTHGNSLFEENLRVPFLLRGPGVAAGTVAARPPSLRDVAPTLLDLAGLPTDGLSGLPVHRGLRERPHPAVDANYFALVQGDRKWIARWGGEALPEGLGLFRTDGGPEARDVLLEEAAGPPEDLREAVSAALARNRYRRSSEPPPEWQLEEFNELGYAQAGAGPQGASAATGTAPDPGREEEKKGRKP